MEDLDLTTLLPKVTEVVKTVGGFIRQEKARFSRGDAEMKGPNDLVSYVDRTAEAQLMTGFRPLIPGCGFINEESGTEAEGAPYVWIIDPLDGTTNFVYDIPVFCISVGLYHGQQTVLGVIYEVNRDECFWAIKDQGAYLNGRRIHVSQSTHLGECLLATGFPFRGTESVEGYLEMLKGFMFSTKGIRRLGSAALDLAYTACGRFDGFFESNLNPWDVSAGALLVKEAGGLVTDYHGGSNYLFGRSIVAGNPTIHAEMMRRIDQVLRTMPERHGPQQP